MENYTNYARKAISEHVTGRTAMSSPTHTYLALYTVAPTKSSSGTEVSGGNYARQQLTWGAANEEGEMATSAAVRFPAASTSSAIWGTIVAVAMCDALTGGHIVTFTALKPTVTIGSGEFFEITAGGITFGQT